jgi:hypothetical protein
MRTAAGKMPAAAFFSDAASRSEDATQWGEVGLGVTRKLESAAIRFFISARTDCWHRTCEVFYSIAQMPHVPTLFRARPNSQTISSVHGPHLSEH